MQRLAEIIAERGAIGGMAALSVGYFTLQDIVLILGVLITVASFLVNWWFKWCMVKIERKKAGLKIDGSAAE